MYKEAPRSEGGILAQMDTMHANAYLIYKYVTKPNLRDPKLQEAFSMKGKKPYGIVDKIFKASEVNHLSLAIVGEDINPQQAIMKNIKNS
jgi:hypothetical protein